MARQTLTQGQAQEIARQLTEMGRIDVHLGGLKTLDNTGWKVLFYTVPQGQLYVIETSDQAPRFGCTVYGVR